MEHVFQYLSNPGFTMSEHGEAARKVTRQLLSALRRDALFRYQALIQSYPIAIDTLGWLTERNASELAQMLYVRGVPAAAAYIPTESLTAELIRTALDNAISGRRHVSPSNLLMLYAQLLSLGGADLVSLMELVDVMAMDPKLGFSYLTAREASFNESLSVVMTVIKRQSAVAQSHEHLDLVSTLYDIHGPSDQWPTLDNVIRYVSAVANVQIQPYSQPAPTPSRPSTLAPYSEQKRGFE